MGRLGTTDNSRYAATTDDSIIHYVVRRRAAGTIVCRLNEGEFPH